MDQGCKDTTHKQEGDMQALSKHANAWEKKTKRPLTEEIETKTVACIKTRLLLGVAKNKEFKTKGESNMTGKH